MHACVMHHCPQDSIAVVGSRFSYGYDVVGCVLDFYKVSFRERCNLSAFCLSQHLFHNSLISVAIMVFIYVCYEH